MASVVECNGGVLIEPERALVAKPQGRAATLANADGIARAKQIVEFRRLPASFTDTAQFNSTLR
jgi:hypothetical protein